MTKKFLLDNHSKLFTDQSETSAIFARCICNFLLYLHQLMFVNAKLDIRGHNRITFQCRRLHWSSLFLMAQLKRSWQYWHSCIVRICKKKKQIDGSLTKEVLVYAKINQLENDNEASMQLSMTFIPLCLSVYLGSRNLMSPVLFVVCKC